MKDLLIQFKYQGKRELAVPLGKLMALTLLKYLESQEAKFSLAHLLKPLPYHAVIPVPLHGERLVERGYNQSELIGKQICKELSLPLWQPVIRNKFTVPLKAQNPEDRAKELAGAFQLVEMESQEKYQDDFYHWEEILKKSRILLIDDIYTTGATVTELARVLQQAGCEYITVLATAH